MYGIDHDVYFDLKLGKVLEDSKPSFHYLNWDEEIVCAKATPSSSGGCYLGGYRRGVPRDSQRQARVKSERPHVSCE